MRLAKYIGTAGLAAALLIPFSAYSENCNDLASNTTWIKGMEKLQSYYQSGNYAKVTETAKSLFTICSQSPTLFYYTGAALEKQGDTERALIYYQKASENLTNMSTDAGISRQIWYKRYELEHPERTQEAVAAQQEKIEELSEQVIELEKENAGLSALAPNADLDVHKIYMWSGIGTGIAGIVLLATGAGLAFSDADNTQVKNNKAHIKSNYLSGWTLFGTGIGLTVIGAALSGYAGYRYSKAKEDALMSVELAPNGASFSMTF